METKICKINPKSIKLLEQNARYMDETEYKQLVENIKKDKVLTSVPFCYYNENNELEVISGNHRVMASIDAGLSEIEVMICNSKLTKQEAIALQLSHNSIVGKDDKNILNELYKKLDDFNLKEYSGLTDEFLEFCKTTEKEINSPNLNYQIFNLVFMPEEIDEIENVLKDIYKTIDKNKNLVISSSMYDDYLNIHSAISNQLNVKNPSTAFMYLVRLASRHLDDLNSKIQ